MRLVRVLSLIVAALANDAEKAPSSLPSEGDASVRQLVSLDQAIQNELANTKGLHAPVGPGGPSPPLPAAPVTSARPTVTVTVTLANYHRQTVTATRPGFTVTRTVLVTTTTYTTTTTTTTKKPFSLLKKMGLGKLRAAMPNNIRQIERGIVQGKMNMTAVFGGVKQSPFDLSAIGLPKKVLNKRVKPFKRIGLAPIWQWLIIALAIILCFCIFCCCCCSKKKKSSSRSRRSVTPDSYRDLRETRDRDLLPKQAGPPSLVPQAEAEMLPLLPPLLAPSYAPDYAPLVPTQPAVQSPSYVFDALLPSMPALATSTPLLDFLAPTAASFAPGPTAASFAPGPTAGSFAPMPSGASFAHGAPVPTTIRAAYGPSTTGASFVPGPQPASFVPMPQTSNAYAPLHGTVGAYAPNAYAQQAPPTGQYVQQAPPSGQYVQRQPQYGMAPSEQLYRARSS